MTTPASQVQLTIVEDVLGELILLDAPATQVVVGTDLSDTAPLPLGTAAAGTSVDGARADHVHAHGDQTGTTLHAAATTSAAGFMSGADKTKLDNATASGTANTLVLRDSSGDFAANVISADLIGNVTGDLTGTASAIADSIVTSAKILDETIVNADISPTADIVVSKLAPGVDPYQLLQTNAAGDGVEWTDNVVVPGDLTVEGDLTVNGTETVINTQTLTVEDKNIELGKVASPTDTTADGGGITLKGATDKTLNWADATDSWTSSEHVDLANGKSFKIDGADVLTSGSLGSTVTSSNLDTVGTLISGAIGSGFTTVATAQGGTGQTTYANGELLIGKTDGTLAKATLSGGTGIDITNADGAVTVDVDSTVVTTVQTGTVTSTMIANGTIVDADVNASAAIAGTKISPDFGSQNISTTGTSTAASLIPTGSTVPVNGIYLPATNSVGISTNGAQRVTVDSTGRLLVNTSTSYAQAGATPVLQQHSVNANSTSLYRWSSNAGGPALGLAKSRGSSIGANAVVVNGDTLGVINFSGDDGANLNAIAATVQAQVDGTPGAGDMPGRILFSTTPSGSGAPTERARIANTGALLVGTTATPVGAGSGAVVAENRVVVGSSAANQIIAATNSNTITATTGTIAFKFKSVIINSARSCYVKIAVSHRNTNNTPSNQPAAEYAFQLHMTSGAVCSIDSATTIFEHTYVRATHFAFADLGSGECTVTLTNPVAIAHSQSAYKVEILSQAGNWTLDSVATT